MNAKLEDKDVELFIWLQTAPGRNEVKSAIDSYFDHKEGGQLLPGLDKLKAVFDELLYSPRPAVSTLTWRDSLRAMLEEGAIRRRFEREYGRITRVPHARSRHIRIARVRTREIVGPALAFRLPFSLKSFLVELKRTIRCVYGSAQRVWFTQFDYFETVIDIIRRHFVGNKILWDQRWLLWEFDHEDLGAPDFDSPYCFDHSSAEAEHYQALGIRPGARLEDLYFAYDQIKRIVYDEVGHDNPIVATEKLALAREAFHRIVERY